MERTKQKSKKEKPNKYVEKERSQFFTTDVKTLKENIKIREILRTVKMNSSMRIKAPRGSKVMQNKDFNENEDIFEDLTNNEGAEGQKDDETPSATNRIVIVADDAVKENSVEQVPIKDTTEGDVHDNDCNDKTALHKSKSLSEGLEMTGDVENSSDVTDNTPIVSPLVEILRARERKLSLDHTMLSRLEGLSKSDLDLHSIGKSPLERKSSFFRKKLDSFLKNTTEIFKRQSSTLSSKSSQGVLRKGSTCSGMSVSLQSLNENASLNGEYEASDKYHNDLKGSTTSLRSSVTPARSNSSLSINQSERTLPEHSEEDSLAGSQTALSGNLGSTSINSLNEGFIQESLLNSRAISMSSGLDTAHGQRKRKTSRSNRVTWVASDSLSDYFRRLIQDEKHKEMQVAHSYQDFSTIPENNMYGNRTDTKGRRLSYVRAVSGEDPVLPLRYMDSSLRRNKILESPEGNNELSACLAEFSRSGVPPLVGFTIRPIPDDALAYLLWAESESNLEEHYDWKKLSPVEEARQAVIKELLHTEADHIRHLMTIVEVYIAAAHALQDEAKLLDLDTSRLFLNIPDVLNANMMFWELVMYPMVEDSFKNNSTFNPDLMTAGFTKFSEIFEPYEDYVCDQTKAVDYLRSLTSNSEFMKYLTWCHSQNTSNRLQLADILVKPMQRLTKYSLIIRRILTYTESEESKALLDTMESTAVSFVHRVNRAIRQREEMEKLDDLEKVLDSYEVEFKDEDMDRYFHLLNDINLKVPMVNCGPDNSRAIIYEGDLKFKDHLKEVEVRAILFTDMLLICKKLSKGGPSAYKMIRPKYMLERTVPFARFSNRNNPHEVTGLIYVVLDEHGSAYTAFCLSETAKDPNPYQTLRATCARFFSFSCSLHYVKSRSLGSDLAKRLAPERYRWFLTWDQKIKEAKISYELSVWFYRNPVNDLSEVEADYSSESYRKSHPEEYIIERRARERVAAMMHPNRRTSTCQDISTMRSDSLEPGRGPPSLRHPLHRTSTGGSSRNSRLSSFHQSTSSRNSRLSSLQQSTSAASHDEPPNALKYLYKAGSSVEHLIPPQNPDDVAKSITVNVVSESECETVVPSRQPTPPMVVVQQSSPAHAHSSGSTGAHTLRVSAHHPLTLVHSLPDLSITGEHHTKPAPVPIQQSASEKLYQSHQELLQRNRLAASHHQYLSPDHRGTSYPPPSPTRASLKRGLAFSYSFKNPPLAKMGHVNSQSQVQTDQASALTKDPSPGTSSDKGEKRKQLMGRSKSSGKSVSPERSPRDDDTASDKPDDDNISRKSDKSAKSNKGDKMSAKTKSDKNTRQDKT